MYNGTSLLRSPMGVAKSDLYGEVTGLDILQGPSSHSLHCGIQFGTERDHNGEVTLLVRSP